LNTFGNVESSGSLCESIWGSLISAKFSDKCIENIKKDQLVNLEKSLVELEKIKDSFKMLDEGAVKEIAENMRKIVDGGSEEMKKAMENFNQLQEKMANF
jgi:hypothetical protein